MCNDIVQYEFFFYIALIWNSVYNRNVMLISQAVWFYTFVCVCVQKKLCAKLLPRIYPWSVLTALHIDANSKAEVKLNFILMDFCNAMMLLSATAAQTFQRIMIWFKFFSFCVFAHFHFVSTYKYIYLEQETVSVSKVMFCINSSIIHFEENQ